MHSTVARRYSASSSVWLTGPGSRTRPSSPSRRIAAPHHLAVLVVLADDHGLERNAATVQHRARLDQHVEALLGDQPADAEDPQRSVAARRGAGAASSRAKSAFSPW